MLTSGLASAPAGAAGACATGGSCLTAFSADLDGDGEPDRVELVYDPEIRLYDVVVYTKAGPSYWPFRGSLDPAKQKVSLTLRTGRGDPRCRSWGEGRECGYPLASHDVPETVLYLSDSKHGDFVIYMSQPYFMGPKKNRYFMVMPALDGLETKTSLPK